MRKMILVATAFVLGVLASSVAAQGAEDSATVTSNCTAPEASQFDFWLGEWNLTWADTGRGTNHITKDFDGCVVREDFSTAGEQPYRGSSASVFDTKSGKWKQTWVDIAGGYLDFVGGWEGDKMVLSRTAFDTSGNAFLQRMVWFNITNDAFDWNWEKSTDDGEIWNVVWAIKYERAKQ